MFGLSQAVIQDEIHR